MKPLLAPLLGAVLSLAARAAGPVPPDVGSILQQSQPVAPLSPSSIGSGLTIERKNEGGLPQSLPFLVKSIRISGNSVFDTATLQALVADADGKFLTLSQLGALSDRITSYYQSHGYPFARALIPAQVIRDGVVAIEITEAHYGKVVLANHSRASNPLLQRMLSPGLDSGQPIGQAGLDHTLLLLSDVPGVVVNATLKPGENSGTSDLLVNTTAAPAVTGDVVIDDYGDRYTGRERIGGTVNFIDPLHQGDVLSMSDLSSGRGINYGRIAYESFWGGDGAQAGGSYSTLHYILGGPLASLDAHGIAQVKSLWVKHPLVRSRNFDLHAQLQYDQLQLRDHIDASAIQTDRHLDTWTASLAGDERDALLFGGTTVWRLDWTAGRVDFDNEDAGLADAETARIQGGFSKWEVNVCRLQSLGPRDGLYLAFSGQWTDSNLDSAEQMDSGGPYTVRAYDLGAVSGDIGYLETAEFRHDLGSAWRAQWQAVAFCDSAQVTINRAVWSPGANTATLSGAGVGLNWAGPSQLSAKLCIAARVGAIPVLVADPGSARGWFEVSKAF